MTSTKYIGMDVHKESKGRYFDCREEYCRQGSDGMRHRNKSPHDSAVYQRAAPRFAGRLNLSTSSPIVFSFDRALDGFCCRLNTAIVGLEGAARTLVCGRASLGLAMPYHLRGVSGRSAVQGIVVLWKPSNDVSQFVKQYRNSCLWSIPLVRRNCQQTVPIGLSWHLHDKRSEVEERPVGIQ